MQLSKALPAELQCQIIEEFKDNKVALTAFTLVSPSWRQQAQACLLSTVFVSTSRPGRDLKAFIAFLEARPRLASYITTLFIIPLRIKKPISRTLTHDEIKPTDMSELSTVLSKLVCLSNLQLRWAHICPFAESDLVRTQLSSLKVLRLQKVIVDAKDGSWKALADLMGMFTSVDRLFLEGVHLDGKGNTPVDPAALARPVHRPSIKSLQYGTSLDRSADALTRFVSMDNLLALNLRDRAYCSSALDQYQLCLDSASSITSLMLLTPFSTSNIILLTLNNRFKLRAELFQLAKGLRPTSYASNRVPTWNI